MHIYETAGWWLKAFPNWNEDYLQKAFMDIMEIHRDKIIMEVTGHDHLAGMRVAQVKPENTVNNQDEQSPFYLNKVLFPGLTGASNTQPGFATFIYDTETEKAEQLKFTYVDVNGTIGLPQDTQFNDLPWFHVDFESKFGLEDLSGESINDFTLRLKDDLALAREYEFNRMGVDTDNAR